MPATIGTTQRLRATPLDHAPDLLALSSDPRLDRTALLTVRGWQLLVGDPVARLRTLGALDRFAEQIGWRDAPREGPPFGTAAVGCLTDGLNPALLSIGADHRPSVAPVPDVDFAVYEWAVAVGPDGRGWLVADNQQRDQLRSWLAGAARTANQEQAAPPGPAVLGISREGHRAAVEQILGWIAAGDLYQANLTMQVAVPWQQTPQHLAAKLWQATPGAAHAALLQLDSGTAVVSASPETFLRTDGEWVTTRPIKGTRPRSSSGAEDAALGLALQRSEKDRAEHVMIVDLERNDLGRVCEPGSVRVTDYAALDPHPTVWHLTSTVRGKLRDGVGLGALLAATFPPGSVTGTPKRIAVARTALLEPVRRGVYCGAVGIVAPGMVDLSVAIRTAVVHDGMASYGTGGGIVADSDPDEEFGEAMAKAAAFYTATGASPP